MKNEYKKYTAIMMICFIMGGFSLIFYVSQLYTNFWGHEVFGEIRNNSMRNFTNETGGNFNRSMERPPVSITPVESLTSPLSLFLLFNGVILLAGGVSLWSITRDKEIKSAKERITTLLLQPEERIIMEELKKSKGDSTQSQLCKKTGMNKVKVHRIVSRLEKKGIVKKYQYGLTNKIVLEKEL